MGNEAKTCPWESISDFYSVDEYELFARWMDEQVTTGEAVEVAVTRPFVDVPVLGERWFRHAASGVVWRLVRPDEPLTGFFEQVT